MIDISNIKTYGWDAAIRGMRNSWNSWDKSDSYLEVQKPGMKVQLGPLDLKLAANLAKKGGSHAKFRRMIGVSMDILAPRYWWAEFDTYKVGTVANSTSTMHTITKRDFTIDDFSHTTKGLMSAIAGMSLMNTVETLNELRKLYLNEENKQLKRMYWYDIIQLLPQSYNQLRTVTMNYEVVAHMVEDRLYHKLDEWQEFCRKMYDNLPYAKELIIIDVVGVDYNKCCRDFEGDNTDGAERIPPVSDADRSDR